ncbi:MAG: hypothetical protein CL810_08795 [Cobetia sp.]|jgi:hypothetical protein|uniref:DUF3261 domain-containing protein n=3 Tax=Halomonadaceae TaxID=28256 RepID=UPI000C455B6F|nr:MULTISPECIES: DUF3261 domain-containing protein [Cobetia]MBK09642.1 hypothetical protein [Cobetia sp.]MDH2296886.1 DUF3261 domain-containing protein [Cobetia sp. 29-18-1]UBU48036.1 DUF3261 domain-containing protein [Cobetia amphilecti]HAR09858.1 hypothetical protein [Cobetia sp.]|tara:strand:+ start:15632 stop:16447 length:816 start_codon:yes stop_codon:yes gene_type:complete
MKNMSFASHAVSTGLHTVGLRSAGLRSTGLHTVGLRSAGLRSRLGLASLAVAATLLLSGCSLLAPQPLEAASPMPALASLEQTSTQRLILRVARIESDDNAKRTVAVDAEAGEGAQEQNLPPLIGVLRQSPEAMRLVMLSVQGQRLLTLVHDADGSRFEKARPEVLEKLPFSADWLARRIAWVHWPQAAIDDAFANTGWQLVQRGDWQQSRQPAQRIITQDGVTIAELTRDASGSVTLRDPAADMQLTLEPLAAPSTQNAPDDSPEAPAHD